MIKQEHSNTLGPAWHNHALWKALAQYRHSSSKYPLLPAISLDHKSETTSTQPAARQHVWFGPPYYHKNFCICCRLWIMNISNTCLNLCFFFFVIRRMRSRRKRKHSYAFGKTNSIFKWARMIWDYLPAAVYYEALFLFSLLSFFHTLRITYSYLPGPGGTGACNSHIKITV